MAESGTAVAWPDHAWLAGATYLAIILAGVAIDLALVVRLSLRPAMWPARAEAVRRRPWALEDCGTLIVLLLFLYFSVTGLRSVVGLAGGAAAVRATIWVVLQSVFFHMAGLGLVWAFLARRRVSWRAAFGLGESSWRRSLALGVLFYVAAMPVLSFYSAAYQVGLRQMGYETVPQEVVTAFSVEPSPWVRAYFVFLAVVLAPAFEEIFFRGIAMPLLAKRWGMVPAVLLVSLGFAVIHFHVPSVVPLFLIAAAFSIGYIYSGSIAVPIVMHGVFNAVNMGMMMVMK